MKERAIRFAKRAIEALPPAEAGSRDYYEDVRFKGLRVSVTNTGAKSWVIQRRIGGHPRRITLGRFPDLGPEQAIREFEKVTGSIASGNDPIKEKRLQRVESVSLRDSFEQFKLVRSLKPKTIATYTQVLTVALEDWYDRPLSKIDRDMVAQRHARLTQNNGAAYADSTMRTFRAVWNFAAAQYENENGESPLPRCPTERLSRTKAWNKPKRRTSQIETHQLRPWFLAVAELRREPPASFGRTAGDYLVLLILTGLRRTEAAELTWDRVDLAGRTLRIVDTKNRDEHVLPLSDYLLELLSERKSAIDSRFVFPGETSRQTIKEPRYQMQRVMTASGVKFALHDLRRTFATAAESLDLSGYTLKRLLNHRAGTDVTAGYVVSGVERLRQPMQRITDAILEKSGVRDIR